MVLVEYKSYCNAIQNHGGMIVQPSGYVISVKYNKLGRELLLSDSSPSYLEHKLRGVVEPGDDGYDEVCNIILAHARGE